MFHGASFDLDAYLTRIGYDDERRATGDVLRALAFRHPLAIPFENLDPFLGQPVPLDIDSLQQKLVRDGRGGYCYEHNLLLGHALAAIGFSVTGLAARVLWNQPPGAITPRTHMVLLIDLDGQPHIVDAGFGGLTLTGVLRLEPDVVQDTPHEPFRLRREGADFIVEATIRTLWTALYRFDLQPQLLPDYQVPSWYLSNHPASHFVTSLVAARSDHDRRYALRNRDFAVHHLSGSTERRVLASAAEIRDTLEQVFQIRLPAGPEVDAALARVTPAVQLA